MLTRFKLNDRREVDLCQEHTARLFLQSALDLDKGRTINLADVEAVELLPIKRGSSIACDECRAGRELPAEPDWRGMVERARGILTDDSPWSPDTASAVADALGWEESEPTWCNECGANVVTCDHGPSEDDAEETPELAPCTCGKAFAGSCPCEA